MAKPPSSYRCVRCNRDLSRNTWDGMCLSCRADIKTRLAKPRPKRPPKPKSHVCTSCGGSFYGTAMKGMCSGCYARDANPAYLTCKVCELQVRGETVDSAGLCTECRDSSIVNRAFRIDTAALNAAKAYVESDKSFAQGLWQVITNDSPGYAKGGIIGPIYDEPKWEPENHSEFDNLDQLLRPFGILKSLVLEDMQQLKADLRLKPSSSCDLSYDSEFSIRTDLFLQANLACAAVAHAGWRHTVAPYIIIAGEYNDDGSQYHLDGESAVWMHLRRSS